MQARSSIVFSLLSLFSCYHLNAQELLEHFDNYGIRIGLHVSLGTHVQRIGLMTGAYFIAGSIQANTEIRANYNRRDLGPPLQHAAFVISQGITIGYGNQAGLTDHFYSPVSNQTGHAYALAYACNFYLNNIGTAQRTGLIHLQFNRFSIITENDILAQAGADKFRTGAVSIQYHHDEKVRVAISCTAWTGRFGKKKMLPDSSWCYMDTEGGLYTDFSHGLLTTELKYALPYGQNIQLGAGLDAEQVRHALQNQLLHHLFSRKNCYMPMLDRQGKAWIPGSAEPIRKSRLLLQGQVNAPVFY